MINWFYNRENLGRIVLITASLFIWLLILISFKYYGYEETWQLWKVPAETPPFLDFRLIPGSGESFRNGFEPSMDNPGDPAGRIFNYPAFWRLFFYTGITQADTIWISALMIVLFFIGIFLFPDRIRIPDAVVMLFIIFSPASMLLFERGNVDLIVFFLCSLVVLSVQYSIFITSALLLFAVLVKLYPFFGVTVLLKEPKTKFILLLLGCLGILLAYSYVNSQSIDASWNLTMRGKRMSYGANVLFSRYGEYISGLLKVRLTNPIFKYGPITLAVLLMLISGVAGLFNHQNLISSPPRNLAAFRMGASIYLGTFLLGNNWDYRLAFLIFVVPQLLEWIRKFKFRNCGGISMITLALVFVSCWHLVFWFSPSLVNARGIIFLVDETANWMLVAGFSYLLFASMPDWVKEQIRFRFQKNAVQVV